MTLSIPRVTKEIKDAAILLMQKCTILGLSNDTTLYNGFKLVFYTGEQVL